MLEIVAQILCAMLLLGGINFIVQAFNRPTDSAAGLISSLAAAAFSIIAAIYFYNVVDDQASGARTAIDEIQQRLAPPVEPVDPMLGD